MSLSRAEVEKIALLARLELDPEELTALTQQLGRIVEYVEQLNELDTESIEPMEHVARLSNVFAEDTVGPSLPREEALRNAPDQDGEYYRVPAVLGEDSVS